MKYLIKEEMDNFKEVVAAIRSIYLNEKSNKELLSSWFELQKIPVVNFITNPFVEQNDISILFFCTISSLTLDLHEKQRVFDEMSTLDHQKYYDLVSIFKDERIQLKKLSIESPEEIISILHQKRIEIIAIIEIFILEMNKEV